MSGRVIMVLDPKNINYKELGFRAGLEIHHQLKSERKLFCHCPTNLDEELQKKPQYTFHRRFRAVMGEMGDFDPGMLVEVEKGYLVIYHANDDHVCTYEMDETPPFWVDMEAIDTGFHLSALFHCESPVEELVINRKQYLDGSITTGFQRTLIVGRDGYVEIRNGKKIRITNILIEEDAARKIKTENRGRTVYYNLDRLGIPLTEIITDHTQIDTPEVLIETANTIGLNMRSTGLVKRGIGVVRQDVNISINGGDRVEIKGIQDLSMLRKWCAHEVCRQHSLIEIKSKLARLQLNKKQFEHTYIDISHHFNNLEDGEPAYCVRLPGFQEILLTEIQPGKDFGYEIFEKCNLITGIQYNEMFHSGEINERSIRWKTRLEELFINKETDIEIRKTLNLSDKDGYVAARGPENPVLHTLKKTVERCKQAFDGVPQETRRALMNGNNEFLRVIHGKDRLYPDTDTPPAPYPMERYRKIKENLRPGPIELYGKYKEGGLSFDNLSLIIRDEKVELFQRLVDDLNIRVSLAVDLLIEAPRFLKREGIDTQSFSDEIIAVVARSITERRIPRSALHNVLISISGENDLEHQKTILEKFESSTSKEDEVREIVSKYIESHSEDLSRLAKTKVIGSIMKDNPERIDGGMLTRVVEEML